MNIHQSLETSAPLVRQESTLPYEHLVWPYQLALPGMLLMAAYADAKKRFLAQFKRKPRYNVFIGDGISRDGAHVRDTATSWDALDRIYNFHRHKRSATLTTAQELLDRVNWFWMNIRAAQAVRNRLLIAETELKRAIMQNAWKGEVNILSLACGSAQAVIIAASEMRQHARIRVVTIDKSSRALAYAHKLAERHGVADLVSTTRGDVRTFETLIGDFQPDIIEMMGFTDYLEDADAIDTFKRIRGRLQSGGTFLTCHVHPNWEKYFLEQIVNWRMLYRTIPEFEELLKKGGFSPWLITEPHRMHSVAVATAS